VTRSTKKQKGSAKKGKSTKEEQLDEEEEEEEEEEKPKGRGKSKGKMEEEEPEEEKGKGKKKGTAKKEESATKKGGKKKKEEEEEEEEEEEDDGKKKKKKKAAKKPEKFKKGKWNPAVTLVTHDNMLEDKTNEPIDYGSVKYNCRNLIRAIHTKNYKLMDNLFAKDFFFTSLFERWAPDHNDNAFELAFKNNDKKAIQSLCHAYNKKIKYAHEPPLGLETFDSGEQSIYAFGVKTRRVEMGRGGKELINAYLKDADAVDHFDDVTIGRIFEYTQDTALLDFLKVEIKSQSQYDDYQNLNYMESTLESHFEKAVVSGNLKVASYLATRMFKKGGFGVVETHADVLSKTDPKKLPSNLRRTSVVAKTIGTNITPIHFACINPNTKMLEFLLTKAPEYSIADYKMRKPIHYAAACESPEPLELLLKNNVDFREGDREKMTPLMVACKYGRLKNVQVLLKLLEKEPKLMAQKSKEGNMAIHLATQGGYLDILKLLFKHKADLNAAGK